MAPGIQAIYRKLLYAIVLLHWSVLLGGCWAVSSAHVHPLACLGASLPCILRWRSCSNPSAASKPRRWMNIDECVWDSPELSMSLTS